MPVEAARLGQMTDYEKLMIEVWNQRRDHPAGLHRPCAKLVKDHMSIFINFEEPVETVETPQDSPRSTVSNIWTLRPPRGARAFRVRSYNCLKNANIQTIPSCPESENENAEDQKLGRKSLNEIKIYWSRWASRW